MDNWKEHLNNLLNKEDKDSLITENEPFVVNLAKALENNELKMLDVVQELGLHLMSTETALLKCGTSFLSALIAGLSSNYLNQQEVVHLLEFYFARLRDHHTLIPAILAGLNALCKCSKFPPTMALQVINQLSLNIHIPSMLSQERFAVYSLISHLLHSCLPELQSQSTIFVQSLITMMDGERDPRCLMLLFTITPYVIRNFSIEPCVEDYFMVLSCYFPVDFTPPPKESIGVTRQDLAVGLQQCLLSTKLFGPLVLPLVLEKLEASMEEARLDALQLLLEGCSVYGWCMEPHLMDLWSGFRTIIFLGSSDKARELAWQNLSAILQLGCSQPHDTPTLHLVPKPNSSQLILKIEVQESNPVHQFAMEIWQDCKQQITGTEARLARLAISTVTACIESDMEVAFLMNEIFQVLLDLYDTKSQVEFKQTILDGVAKAELALPKAAARRKVLFNTSGCKPVPARPVWHQEILELCFTVLGTADSQPEPLVTSALRWATKMEELQEDKYTSLNFHHYLEGLCATSSPNIRSVLLEVLEEVDLRNLDATKDLIFKPHLELLESKAPDPNKVEVACSILTAMKHHPSDVVPAVFRFFLSKLNSDPSLAQMAGNCLLQLVTLPSSAATDCLAPLTALHVDSSIAVPLPEEVLNLIETILKGDPVSDYVRELLADLFHLYVTLDPSQARLLKVGSVTETGLLPALHSFLVYVPLETLECRQVMGRLVDLQHYGGDGDIYRAQCAALLLNRAAQPEPLISQAFLSSPKESIESCMELGDCAGKLGGDSTNVAGSILLATWLTKALVLRGHPQAQTFLHKMLEWLDSPKVGEMTAKGFSTILQPDPEVFRPGTANIRLLYQQWMFLQTWEKLLEGSQLPDSARDNYLLALTGVLRHTPPSAMTPYISTLAPVLLTALTDSCPTELQCGLVEAIQELVASNPDLLTDHVHNFTPRLLQLLTPSLPLKVKNSALDCLITVSSLPEFLLLPLRPHVLRTLAQTVDDPKRCVRERAVRARNKWLLVGQPKA